MVKGEHGEFNSERIWNILFEKCLELGMDYRQEIRRANIFTLENILMTHGQLLEEQVWKEMLKTSLLQMLRNSLEMYVSQKTNPHAQHKNPSIDAGLPTPSFSSGWNDPNKKKNT